MRIRLKDSDTVIEMADVEARKLILMGRAIPVKSGQALETASIPHYIRYVQSEQLYRADLPPLRNK